MYTLKMKVLLFITSTHLWRSFWRALLIWLLAGTVGGLILKLVNGNSYDSFMEEMITLCVLGLIFSLPALIVAVPVLYFVHRFQTTFERIIFSVSSILFTCALLILAYRMIFGLPVPELIRVVMPFISSALGAYFLIMRKPITKSYPA